MSNIVELLTSFDYVINTFLKQNKILQSWPTAYLNIAPQNSPNISLAMIEDAYKQYKATSSQ